MVVVEVPAHNVVNSREVGCQVLISIHGDDAFHVCRVVLPTREGHDLVVRGGQFHYFPLFVHALAVDSGAGRNNLHQIALCPLRQCQVQGVGVHFVEGGYQVGILSNIEGIGVRCRNLLAVSVRPGCEMIAEVFCYGECDFITLVEDAGIRGNCQCTGLLVIEENGEAALTGVLR